MTELILRLVLVPGLMIAAHESGHVFMTRWLGGRFAGVVFRGVAVGVRLNMDGLTPGQIAWTLVAGPVAEALIVAVAGLLFPVLLPWWLAVLAADWGLNLVPWGFFPNDGTRLWRLWRTATV